MKDPVTLTVERKYLRTFKKMAVDYDLEQYKLFGKMVKIMKQFKPKLKEVIKK